MDEKVLDKLVQERMHNLVEQPLIPAAVTGTAQMISGPLLATSLLISIGTTLYKMFISKKERACVNYSGALKTLCLLKYEINACQQAINKLNQVKGKCANTRNREDCERKLNAKIAEYDEKIREYNIEIDNLKRYKMA
jgi:hypothetical protein